MIYEALTFDDVLLIPQYSEISTRSEIDLKVKISKPDFEVILDHPIIPANMKTIIGYEMADIIYKSGGLALIHRFMPFSDQMNILYSLNDKYGSKIWKHVGLSVGVQEENKKDIQTAIFQGVQILCIDVAHGDSLQCIKMTEWIAKTFPQVLLISGNVSTGSGAMHLWDAGADIVKIGQGSGALCTTRIETGNGVPQLTALMDVAKMRNKMPNPNQCLFISDGGVKHVGDLVKALCFADMVMVGNMFAGCDETPGTITNIEGRMYKEYVGSSTYKTNHIEGVAALVPYKGSCSNIMSKMLEGLRSGMSYQGAQNLSQMKNNPTFIKMSSAGLRESHPHDVIMR